MLLKSKIKELSHVAVQRRTEISRDKSYLSRAIQNLIRNINRTRLFKCKIFLSTTYICPVWWTSVSTHDWYSHSCKLCSATRQFVSTRFKGFSIIKISRNLNSSFRYIGDVLSLNNSRLGDYLHLYYQNELEVKDTTDTQQSVS